MVCPLLKLGPSSTDKVSFGTIRHDYKRGSVVKLVYTYALGAYGEIRGGSSPLRPTAKKGFACLAEVLMQAELLS